MKQARDKMAEMALTALAAHLSTISRTSPEYEIALECAGQFLPHLDTCHDALIPLRVAVQNMASASRSRERNRLAAIVEFEAKLHFARAFHHRFEAWKLANSEEADVVSG